MLQVLLHRRRLLPAVVDLLLQQLLPRHCQHVARAMLLLLLLLGVWPQAAPLNGRQC